jgi:hypothetical protein
LSYKIFKFVLQNQNVGQKQVNLSYKTLILSYKPVTLSYKIVLVGQKMAQNCRKRLFFEQIFSTLNILIF